MPSTTSFKTRSISAMRWVWRRVRVAILSAMETVTTKVPSTIEAAALCKMAERGQITGAVLDGPLALDNAISPEAAAIKKIASPVAGRANILVVPDLEAGNMLAKSLSFLAKADAAGIVLGARVPIILTSRADSLISRLASCAVAAMVAAASLQVCVGGDHLKVGSMSAENVRPVLAGQRALVIGVANQESIAYGCAKAFRTVGAELAISWLNEKARRFVQTARERPGGFGHRGVGRRRSRRVRGDIRLDSNKVGVDWTFSSIRSPSRRKKICRTDF